MPYTIVRMCHALQSHRKIYIYFYGDSMANVWTDCWVFFLFYTSFSWFCFSCCRTRALQVLTIFKHIEICITSEWWVILLIISHSHLSCPFRFCRMECFFELSLTTRMTNIHCVGCTCVQCTPILIPVISLCQFVKCTRHRSIFGVSTIAASFMAFFARSPSCLAVCCFLLSRRDHFFSLPLSPSFALSL